MNISWYGQSCFRILAQRLEGREKAAIVIDPFDKKLGISMPSVEGDLLLISHDHFDHNNVKAVKGDPFIISESGEYEVADVFVKGIPGFRGDVEGAERGPIVMFAVQAEGIRLCHLSDLGQQQLTDEQVAAIGRVDVLMIPVGGTHTIDAKTAATVTSQLDPRIVIPMHYALPKLTMKLDAVDDFVKHMGQKSVEPVDVLKIQQKDIEGDETEIVLLQQRQR